MSSFDYNRHQLTHFSSAISRIRMAAPARLPPLDMMIPTSTQRFPLRIWSKPTQATIATVVLEGKMVPAPKQALLLEDKKQNEKAKHGNAKDRKQPAEHGDQVS